MENIVEKLISEGVDKEGFLTENIMKIIKKTTPVFCVDIVIVPESDKPSVILFKRSDKNATACGIYWMPGGKQRLGEPMNKTAERKIKQETGLTINVKPEDQLFVIDIFHKIENGKVSLPFENEKDLPKDKRLVYYHTPAVCYLARAPPFEEIKDKIKAGEGNNDFKLFTSIDSSLDPYVKKAIREAWKKLGYCVD